MNRQWMLIALLGAMAAAQAAKMNAAAQPTFPQAGPYSFSEASDHRYNTSAGATPKLTRSDNESY